MKNLILSVLLLAFPLLLIAQIRENKRPMSKGNQPCLMVTVTGLDLKEVEEVWQDWVNKDLKGKKPKQDRKTKEYFSDDLELKSISENTVDVYCIPSKTKDGVQLDVFFDLGGAFLASATHPTGARAAEVLLGQFLEKTQVRNVELELTTQAEALKNLQKELEKLEKDQANLEDEIKKYEERIADAKKEIEKSTKAQADKAEEINKQAKVVEDIQKRLKKMN